MSFDYLGVVAVVTGAASGIGRALALDLAGRGANLAIADRDGAALAETAALCRAKKVEVSEHVFDMIDVKAIADFPAAVLALHRKVDLLINNAGVAVGGDFEQVAPQDFEWLMAINFWGPVHMCRAFLPALRSRPSAYIVNISSLFGLIAPAGQTAYCAAKFGLRGFSESLQHELEDSSIGVSTVFPGGVRTNIANSARMPVGDNSGDVHAMQKKFNSLLKIEPADAAKVILEGVQGGKPRIIIGSEARQADVLQRLMPVKYWGVIKRQLVRALR